MKKNRKMSLTLAAALALTALTACGSMSASAAIDAAAAKQVAADHLGVNVSDLKVLECERDDGKYELEVLVGDVKYDFEIGASSGKVLEVDRDRRDRDDWDDRYDDDWDDRYDDDWDDRYDDDWDDRYDDDWDDRYDEWD